MSASAFTENISEKRKEDQQELIKKQFERNNKSLREQREIKWKNTQKRQQDSLDSIRKIQRNNNMKLLKEAQKKLQEEEIKELVLTRMLWKN